MWSQRAGYHTKASVLIGQCLTIVGDVEAVRDAHALEVRDLPPPRSLMMLAHLIVLNDHTLFIPSVHMPVEFAASPPMVVEVAQPVRHRYRIAAEFLVAIMMPLLLLTSLLLLAL